jgi:parallel beta-helix repeat protein
MSNAGSRRDGQFPKKNVIIVCIVCLLVVIAGVIVLIQTGTFSRNVADSDKAGADVGVDLTPDAKFVSPAGDDGADGSYDAPWATVNASVDKLKPGDTLYIREGTYNENVSMTNISGTEKDGIIHVASYQDEAAIIDGGGGEDDAVFTLTNCEYITIEGLELINAGIGIDYESTTERGAEPLRDVTFLNNKVHDIEGQNHGICVYAHNYLAPMTNLIMDGNEVYFTRTYWSEATVFNGNIDGFTIRNNVIHNGNNIGIDMIGFEGTARSDGGEGDGKDYVNSDANVDFARNGVVYNNIIYGSNTNDNEAYWYPGPDELADEEDEDALDTFENTPFGGYYDRCCDGIYVDGGSYIEIYNNFIFDNDIGIEVATEHREDRGFFVTDVNVHDNIIASSGGWCGIAFGGYEETLGPTVDSSFTNNILYGNQVGIAMQMSRDNKIENNVIVGGEAAIDCELIGELNDKGWENYFGVNDWQNADEGTYGDDYYAFFEDLWTNQAEKQVKSSADLLSAPSRGDFSLTAAVSRGAGTAWAPPEAFSVLYADFVKAHKEVLEAVDFLESEPFTFEDALADDGGNLKTYLTDKLKDAGFANSEVRYILRTGAGMNAGQADGHSAAAVVTLTQNEDNGVINPVALDALKTGIKETKDIAYLVQVITWYAPTSYTQELTLDSGVIIKIRP